MLDASQHDTLLDIARQSIRYGLAHGKPLPVEIKQYDSELQNPQATFVTLNKEGQLRGCIGMLQAIRPLVEDVADNAFNAAFRDPRFPPVNDLEVDQLEIHISILTQPTPVQFLSEEDLINQLRPNVDGLILTEGNNRGTFLPSVWEQLPEPKEFLEHLKRKAGLPPGYWSDSVKIERYAVEEF